MSAHASIAGINAEIWRFERIQAVALQAPTPAIALARPRELPRASKSMGVEHARRAFARLRRALRGSRACGTRCQRRTNGALEVERDVVTSMARTSRMQPASRATSHPTKAPCANFENWPHAPNQRAACSSERGCKRSGRCAHNNSVQRSSTSHPICRSGLGWRKAAIAGMPWIMSPIALSRTTRSRIGMCVANGEMLRSPEHGLLPLWQDGCAHCSR